MQNRKYRRRQGAGIKQLAPRGKGGQGKTPINHKLS